MIVSIRFFPLVGIKSDKLNPYVCYITVREKETLSSVLETQGFKHLII